MMYVEGLGRNMKVFSARSCINVYAQLRQNSGLDFGTHLRYLRAGQRLAVAGMTALTLACGYGACKEVSQEQPSPPLALVFALLAAGAGGLSYGAFQMQRFSTTAIRIADIKGETFAEHRVRETASRQMIFY